MAHRSRGWAPPSVTPAGAASSGRHACVRPSGRTPKAVTSRSWTTTVAAGEAAPQRFYVDTSAYLCILLGEAGWESLSKELAGGEMLASVLLLLEAHRNLIRLTRE